MLENFPLSGVLTKTIKFTLHNKVLTQRDNTPMKRMFFPSNLFPIIIYINLFGIYL